MANSNLYSESSLKAHYSSHMNEMESAIWDLFARNDYEICGYIRAALFDLQIIIHDDETSSVEML